MKVRNALLLAAAMACAAVLAQAPAIKRVILQRGDVTADREVVLGRAEIEAGGATGRHTHFGPETGMVLEGTTVLEIDGEPPKILKAGDSYFIPAGVVHNAKAEGGTAKVIATYVVEKGKPLATPAP
ncbi:MAG TPA: cupin domain-containing protein [Usitatibacter sp.]|nr:cupin domain-containing protein [Usitatibacter sp.]